MVKVRKHRDGLIDQNRVLREALEKITGLTATEDANLNDAKRIALNALSHE